MVLTVVPTGLGVWRVVKVHSCYSLRIVPLSPECPSTSLANTLWPVPAVPSTRYLGGLRGGAVGLDDVVMRVPQHDPDTGGRLPVRTQTHRLAIGVLWQGHCDRSAGSLARSAAGGGIAMCLLLSLARLGTMRWCRALELPC